MAHGITENRANVLKYASIFADCGCAMLMYDHRGHGRSDGETLSGGFYEAKDVLAAVKYLQKRGGLSPKQIGLIGESWGAAAVLLAAAQNDSLEFVLAESPYSAWHDVIVYRADKQFGKWVRALLPITYAWVRLRAGVDVHQSSPREAVDSMAIPTLIIHSAADTITPPEQSLAIGKHLNPTIGKVMILDWEAWHAHNALARPEEYKTLVLNYFTKQGIAVCE
jgi:dipeptidyl aminopeptidase/acylaminoacyl peptidase